VVCILTSKIFFLVVRRSSPCRTYDQPDSLVLTPFPCAILHHTQGFLVEDPYFYPEGGEKKKWKRWFWYKLGNCCA
jgi:hypothetical protein